MADITPLLRYRDAMDAVEFLERAFGFERKVLDTDDDGRVLHSELRFGDGLVMVASTGEPDDPIGHAATYLVVEDPDAHHAAAMRAGATEVYPPKETSYGSREYAVRDPEGNVWYVGTYQP